MTSLAERAALAAETHPVERFEIASDGALLLELRAQGEPSWMRLCEDHAETLDLAGDRDLPLGARLADLRREEQVVVLAWRPGRRAVVGSSTFVLKGFRKGRLQRSLVRQREGARALCESGLVVTELAAVEPAAEAFRLHRLQGRRPDLSGASAQNFAALGAALARFQTLAPREESLARHDLAAELAVLDALAHKARLLRTQLPQGWEAARAETEQALRSLEPAPLVLAHRDLHDGQLLECAAGLALLDYDLLCLADAGLDPANLLAHLELRVLQGLASSAGARACEAAFTAEYSAGAGRERERRLDAWRAASLTRLALVYHLRPPFAHLAVPLAARALACALEANS